MTDPSELALLAGVLAHPADDTPRLVYADWLDEHGRPERAEFVRVQCELGADPIETLEVNALRRRERELWDGGVWKQVAGPRGFEWDLHPNYGGRGLGQPHLANMRRGFVSSLTCTAADWLAHADAIYWRPGQTVECEKCDDGTVGDAYDRGMRSDCRHCLGTGRVPRPCPPTAQPVEVVRLTTPAEPVNDLAMHCNTEDGSWGNWWWSHRWPGVRFELPTVVIPVRAEDLERCPEEAPALTALEWLAGRLRWELRIHHESPDYPPPYVRTLRTGELTAVTDSGEEFTSALRVRCGDRFGPVRAVGENWVVWDVTAAVISDVQFNMTLQNSRAELTAIVVGEFSPVPTVTSP